jgi:hypothetical protein
VAVRADYPTEEGVRLVHVTANGSAAASMGRWWPGVET